MSSGKKIIEMSGRYYKQTETGYTRVSYLPLLIIVIGVATCGKCPASTFKSYLIIAACTSKG